jgi:predicted RNA-binding protein with PUA-like domain
MKSEPSTYSYDDLVKDSRTMWEGVRNYQARNFMRDDMARGDLALFYHSSAKPTGVVGLMRVCSDPYPDPTQFDAKSKYHDPTSDPDDPRWILVDVEPVEALQMVTLADLKAEKSLSDMLVVQKGQRLSVQPVDKKHFKKVLTMAKAKTKIR